MKFFYVLAFLCIIGALMMGTNAQRSNCICPAVYDPVCSKTGQTYINSCQMSCAGASLDHRGACGEES